MCNALGAARLAIEALLGFPVFGLAEVEQLERDLGAGLQIGDPVEPGEVGPGRRQHLRIELRGLSGRRPRWADAVCERAPSCSGLASMRTLPIDASRDALAAALSTPGERPVVVVAPTGSGKSTRLPLWLDAWGHGPVLVIEPRRVACRALAGFLREAVPEARVGYRVRFEDVSDASTRILFVTPGVALRLLTAAELPFRSVLFDEFHERGLEVDLALCVLRARQAPPRLVLTSATVEGPQLAARLDATLVEAMGRSYPVTIEHEAAPDAPTSRDLIPRLHTALARLPDDDGDALVFLPGKGEIEAAQRELAGLAAARGISLLPLHGSQSAAESARALRPTTGRRVVLATNVAETSLTLPGITRVIDSGLERRRQHRAGRYRLCAGR